MTRSKDLEQAVADLLDARNLRYMRVDNYRCFKCGQVQNSKATGHPDFEVYYPHFYIECKTGEGKLTDEQKEIRHLLEKSAHYIVVRDNIDELVKFIDMLLPGYTIPGQGKSKRRLHKKVMG